MTNESYPIPKLDREIQFEGKKREIEDTIHLAYERIRIAKNDLRTFTGREMMYILNRDIDCHQDAIIRLRIRLEHLCFKYDI
jgi:hypothetical protein